VYNAEKILRLSGYEVDMPDTRLDAKTSAALAEFQQDCGLWPYGTLDFATQKALNEKLDSLMLQIDKQYAKAVELLKK
jgi:carboxyl-terminal processing protease